MRENDARRALDEALERLSEITQERDRINRDAERHARRAEVAEAALERSRAAHTETMGLLDKANERAERWEKAYGRLEAKLANARIKARALASALE